VGVDDAADLGELAVEKGVGVKIAGRAQMAFDDFAVKVRNDQVGRGEGSVVDSAGLDHDERLRARPVDTWTTYAAGIAEGVRGKSAPGYFLIGFKNLLPY
jgi:hypothetical protein